MPCHVRHPTDDVQPTQHANLGMEVTRALDAGPGHGALVATAVCSSPLVPLVLVAGQQATQAAFQSISATVSTRSFKRARNDVNDAVVS